MPKKVLIGPTNGLLVTLQQQGIRAKSAARVAGPAALFVSCWAFSKKVRSVRIFFRPQQLHSMGRLAVIVSLFVAAAVAGAAVWFGPPPGVGLVTIPRLLPLSLLPEPLIVPVGTFAAVFLATAAILLAAVRLIGSGSGSAGTGGKLPPADAPKTPWVPGGFESEEEDQVEAVIDHGEDAAASAPLSRSDEGPSATSFRSAEEDGDESFAGGHDTAEESVVFFFLFVFVFGSLRSVCVGNSGNNSSNHELS